MLCFNVFYILMYFMIHRALCYYNLNFPVFKQAGFVFFVESHAPFFV